MLKRSFRFLNFIEVVDTLGLLWKQYSLIIFRFLLKWPFEWNTRYWLIVHCLHHFYLFRVSQSSLTAKMQFLAKTSVIYTAKWTPPTYQIGYIQVFPLRYLEVGVRDMKIKYPIHSNRIIHLKLSGYLFQFFNIGKNYHDIKNPQGHQNC